MTHFISKLVFSKGIHVYKTNAYNESINLTLYFSFHIYSLYVASIYKIIQYTKTMCCNNSHHPIKYINTFYQLEKVFVVFVVPYKKPYIQQRPNYELIYYIPQRKGIKKLDTKAYKHIPATIQKYINMRFKWKYFIVL